MNKLLLVDDSRTIINTLKDRSFEGGLFEPVLAESYSDLELVLEHEKDFFVAIVDLMLPDCKDGAAVDLCLKHKIPTIVLTGSLNQELRDQILSKPIVDFIIKNSKDDIHSAVSLAEDMLYFSGNKVLILDNSITRRKYISIYVKDLMFEILEASSGDEALEILMNNEDIKIVTINNERDDYQGPDLAKIIRQNPTIRKNRHNRGVVIFGVSSNASGYLRSTYIKNGANDLLSIPFSKEEFNSKIINNLRMTKTMDELEKKNSELEETVKILDEYYKAVDAGGVVSKSDLEGNITYVNDAFCEMTGYTRDELIGQPHSMFRDPSTPREIFKEMWDTIQNKKTWKGVLKNINKFGESFYINATIVPILNNEGEIIEYVAMRQNITELIKSREEVRMMFQTDTLTSLGNRVKLVNDINMATHPMLAILDIDSFKEINSFYGNETGDIVLKELGNRLFEFFDSKTHRIYRTNSNEFGILSCEKFGNFEKFIKQIKHIVKNIRLTPFMVKDFEIDVRLSTALAEGKDDILNRANLTLKTAKSTKQNILKYNQDTIKTSDAYKNNIFWTKVIKSALTTRDIVPYFQPIVHSLTQKVYKYEALMRLQQNNKTITPFHFLDVAKKTKYYPYMTRLMAEKCFDILNRTNYNLSINLSVEDIADTRTMEFLDEMLDAYQVGNRVTFEIVESEGIESFDEVENFIYKVKNKGCMVAIDDFGTGYSNFEYLMHLKADFIKIDGSIISNISTDSGAHAITEAIVGFAKKNNIKIIAEFVSSESIYKKVKELEIDYCQGYYFGKPTKEIV